MPEARLQVLCTGDQANQGSKEEKIMPEIKETYRVEIAVTGNGRYQQYQEFSHCSYEQARKIFNTLSSGNDYKTEWYYLPARSVIWIKVVKEPRKEPDEEY